MKTLILALSTIAFFSISLSAQTIELQFNKSSYNGGYNISCNGATDGSVTMIVIGGTAPYTYQWSNSATTKDISNLTAGTYNVTVTDDNSVTATGSVTLLQPSVLGKTLTPSNYNGYNISIYGLDNGSINLGVSGGTPPYSYLWSNSETSEDLENLVAGNYTVTITDMNNCTTTGSITLTQPTQLLINSITSPTNAGGFNISCYGGSDGSITVNASGGVPNYTYSWEHGPTSNPLNNQVAGTYNVVVTDRNGAEVTTSITLTQPAQLNYTLTRSIYNNDYNLSCFNCANGFINTTVTGGVSGYTYDWQVNTSSGWTAFATTQNITNLDAGQYLLKVTDALGCWVGIDRDIVNLYAPPRDDWSMQGNADTDPNTQYMGTSDATDFVMRTNGQEALRITEDGNLKVAGLAGNGGSLYLDQDGILNLLANTQCSDPAVPFWSSEYVAVDEGKMHPCPINTNIGIGTSSPSERLSISHNKEDGGISLNREDDGSGWQKSEIKFAFDGTNKMALGYGLSNDGENSFFIWDHLANSGAGATRFYINKEGQVGIGYQPPHSNTQTGFKLFVEGGIKARELKITTYLFADYVFEEDYKLMSIKEYGDFIRKNKHLPGIPSEKEIIANEGFDVGALSVKLLEKIEEQALYIIQLQNQIDEIRETINNN